MWLALEKGWQAGELWLAFEEAGSFKCSSCTAASMSGTNFLGYTAASTAAPHSATRSSCSPCAVPRLLPAFNTPTGLPWRHVNPATGEMSGEAIPIGEAAVPTLELAHLAHLTGEACTPLPGFGCAVCSWFARGFACWRASVADL